MLEHSYYKDQPLEEIQFPDVGKRRVGHLVRNVKPISGYRAIVDRNNDRTFAIVKKGYELVPHEDVIANLETIVAASPEWGTPTREIFMSNYGGRMKTRWTFKEVDFKIGNLPDGTPDIINPTMEAFCSLDTSLAQAFYLGGFRLICTNGLKVGKMLAEYKRKHTASLDLERAQHVITQGMQDYSTATDMWLGYKERDAFLKEVNAFEVIGFNKTEKINVEKNIKAHAEKVLVWEGAEPEDREIKINAWELYNVFTEEASHQITDITRQQKVFTNIANTFVN